MSTNNAQELYNKALQCWQNNESEKAIELVDQALKLAPENLDLHCLAMHVKSRGYKAYSSLPHAEFIMDHDIHYNDTLAKDPREVIDLAMYTYSCAARESSYDKEKDFDFDDIVRRYHKFATKVLKAGYPVIFVDSYVDALVRLGLFDEAFTIGKVCLKLISGKEVGLPGLDKTDYEDSDSDEFFFSIIRSLHKVFMATWKLEEARDFYIAHLKNNPEDWIAYDYLGKIYCYLNQPEEAARQWINGLIEKGWDDDGPSYLYSLCHQIKDPDATKKKALIKRIEEVKKTLPQQLTTVAESLCKEIYRSIGYREKKILDETYIETKLGVKLPPLQPEHLVDYEKIWLPETQGEYPLKPVIEKVEPEEQSKPVIIVSGNAKSDLSTIRRYGIDVTELAAKGKLPPIIGRDAEIDSLIRILLRMEKNNPVLLGPAGTGKTAIIYGLAQRIVSGSAPSFLKDKKVFELSMTSLVAGTTFRGDFESRLTNVIKEAAADSECILFVDELHTIMGAGAANDGNLDAANIVKPALAKGTLRLAGATTLFEYNKRIEKDPAMARRFTPVMVSEMDRATTIEVLKSRSKLWRENHKIDISDDLIILTVDLTATRIRNRSFPDKAIDLLDEAGAMVRTLRSADKNGLWKLCPEDIHQVLSEWTGGAVISKPDKNDKQTLRKPTVEQIIEQFREHIIGQNKAIERLAEAVLRYNLSLKNFDTPMVLLMYGLPGTGKSTCCKALASVLWPGQNDRIMTVNCSEFGDYLALHRLIGPPPGYSGFDNGGILTARLKRQPHSLIVVANLTDAHFSVQVFFEQLFKHGSYSDPLTGRFVSAADAVFVVKHDTSDRSQPIGFSCPSDKINDEKLVITDLQKKGLSQVFTGLFSSLIPLQPNSSEIVTEIISVKLKAIEGDYHCKGISVSFSESIPQQLTNHYLGMSADKRNIDILIDDLIISQIRDVVLENGNNTVIEIESISVST